MKKILLLSAFLFVGFLSFGQSFQWAKAIAGINGAGNAIERDANGNVYIVGKFHGFSGSVDFDPDSSTTFSLTTLLPSFIHYHDAFILKLDSNGAFKWAKQLRNLFGAANGPNKAEAMDIKIDGSGNIYEVGYFNNDADFDPDSTISYNITHIGYQDIYIRKFDSNGNFINAKTFGSDTKFCAANAVDVDQMGNIFIAGYFMDTVDFNPDTTISTNFVSNGDRDVFILSLDSNMNYRWAKTFGGDALDYAINMSLDVSGNIHLVGQLSDTVYVNDGIFTDTLYSNGEADIFVASLNNTGTINWIKSMGGKSSDIVQSIDRDNLGNIYLAGSFRDTVDFDMGIGNYNLVSKKDTSNTEDIFIAKYNSLGDFIWAKSIGGFENDRANSLKLNGNTFSITGYFTDSVDFDPSSANFYQTSNAINDFDIFIAKYDTAGGFLGALKMGGVNPFEMGNDIILSNNYVYSTGLFRNTSDFNPSAATYNLNGEIYISKLKDCEPTFSVSAQTTCDSIIINGITYTQSGVYYQAYINSQGCDSTRTLNLTINHPSSNIINQSACNTYTLNNQIYTASGTYNQTLTNAQGCDSFLTINLTINSTTATASANGLVLTASPSGATYQWLNCNPYFIIPGETNQTYSVTANGDYAVVVIQNGCSDTSNCITFTNVGVNEIELTGISVYPNPSSGAFVISSTNNFEKASLKVLNALGQVVYEKNNVSGKEFEINLANQAIGFYTLEISEGDKVSRLKLLKE